MKSINKVVLTLSPPLAVLIIIASCVGLLIPEIYSAETAIWQAQSIGQDLVDLILVAPILLVASIFVARNEKMIMPVWGGILLYIIYTFILYCFNVHFNRLFIIYCICLGLSFYGFVYFIGTGFNKTDKIEYQSKSVGRLIGIYFISISSLFWLLWMSEIVPSVISGTTPKSVIDTGLFTNGVHVLDISIVLPAIFMVGVLLLKNNQWGVFLAPVILIFIILMDLTIGTLVIVMREKGIDSSVGLAIVMGILAIVSLSLLIWHFKEVRNTQVEG